MNNSPEALSKFEVAARPFAFGQSSTRDVLLVCGAILLLAAALFTWAAFLRKRPHRSKSSWRPPQAAGHSHHKRHRRHRHHDERPMNPTLAETGGLPNPRGEHSGQGGEHPGHSTTS